jgi:hypothetical protein
MPKIDQWPKDTEADKIGKELPKGTEIIDHPDGKKEFIFPEGGINFKEFNEEQKKKAEQRFSKDEDTLEPSFSAENLVQMNKDLKNERKLKKGETSVSLTNQDRKKLERQTREV